MPRYYQRRRITRLGGQIMQYAEELWQNGQEFILARRQPMRPRNSGACMNYGRPCMYLPLCSGSDTVDSGKWRSKSYVHGELPIYDDGQQGRTMLTNSRIRTFQTCRRKEQLSYEIGIEKNDPEEVETLAWGTLWHKALAAYWSTMREQQLNAPVPAPATV